MRIGTFDSKEKKLLFWENGDNSAAVRSHMLDNNVTGIVFSKHLGFTGDIVTIGETFGFVDELNIIDSNIRDISFIVNFPNTKHMNIQNEDNTKLDFYCFNDLESLFLTWRKGIANLFNKRYLKTLKLEYLKEKILPDFEDDMQLEELSVANSPVVDLSSLRTLKKLKKLQLGYLRCLEDSKWLHNLGSLEFLWVESCRKISHEIIYNISGLTELRKLLFSKMGEIDTLEPIISLRKLETLHIIEGTQILDGDLTPVLELHNLRKFTAQGYKHYSPSVSSIRDRINPESAQ